MCQKCVRKAKRLGHKPFTYGQIKAMAHQLDVPIAVLEYNLRIYRSIPLFKNRGINLAIEGHAHKIRRKKTNKKIYNRKRI